MSEYIKEFKDTEKALEVALDVRSFEISLYWKRSSFFWAFVAASIGAYAVVRTAEEYPGKLVEGAIIFLGMTFSHAWYAVTRASKFWQENWEAHVDNLMNEEIGPLFNLVARPDRRGLLKNKALSVSRINMGVAINAIIVWAVIAYNFLKNTLLCDCQIKIITVMASVLIVLIANTIMVWEFHTLMKSRLSNKRFDQTFDLRG